MSGGAVFNATAYAAAMRSAALLIIEAAETLDRLSARGLSVTPQEARLLNEAGEHVGKAGTLCEQGTSIIAARVRETRGGRFA